jgi:hypothetical protein
VTVLEAMAASDSAVIDLLSRGAHSSAPRQASAFDNRPTWDNAGGGSFDNRPSWDNWSKR